MTATFRHRRIGALAPALVILFALPTGCAAGWTGADSTGRPSDVARSGSGEDGATGRSAFPLPPPDIAGADMPAPLTGFHRFSRPFLFSASDGIHGYELFAYDGMNAPTMAADIRTADDSPDGGSSPSGMTSVGGRVYLSADDGRRGRELFVYDTASGKAVLAAEINRKDEGGSDPQGLFAHRGTLYFSADDKGHGRELWSYDTAGGRARTYDLSPGGDSDPGGFSACGGKLFFSAASPSRDGRRALWMQEAPDVFPTTVPALPGLNIGDVSREASGARILLTTDNGMGGDLEIWSYDCVEGTARSLARIEKAGGSSHDGIVVSGDRVYFQADDGKHGSEVWSFDVPDGTLKILELNARGGSYPAELTGFAGRVFFSAFDGNSRLLCSVDASPSTSVSCFPSFHDPVGLRAHEGVLFFSAFVPCRGECSESLGRELWRYDGINPPSMAQDIWPGQGNGM